MPAKTITIKIHYSNNQYHFTPLSYDADPLDTVNFEALDQSATVCFSPSDGFLGASLNVTVGENPLPGAQVPAGTPENTIIAFCVTNLNGTCTPSSIVATASGTIKIGSGSTMVK